MATPGLAPPEASKLKAEPARMPALKPHPPGGTHALPNLLSSAGNMAIQRAVAGPMSSHSTAILGGTSMSGGDCACGGTCDECKKPIQTKLTIGAVDDPLEHEADSVAEHVMRMPDRAVQDGPTASDMLPEGPAVQRKSTTRPQIAAGSSAAPVATYAPPIVHEVLRSPGQSLDAGTRSFMEPRFGRDFSGVRVHTDSSAAKSASAVNALAYTAGNNIVFAEGRYAPHSSAGQRLLAHELAHTVQQGNGLFGSPTASQIQRSPDEPAGGCGLCYGVGRGKVGPRDAGTAVHKEIQKELALKGVTAELPLGKGRVDLAVVREDVKEIAFGEIKPANERGIDDGVEQIEQRVRTLSRLKKYRGWTWVKLDRPLNKTIPFYTEAPFCLGQPDSCYFQDLRVIGPVDGLLYLYYCKPSYSELLSDGCTCKCKKEKDKDKEPGEPGESVPEQLLKKLGEKLGEALAVDGLLDLGLALVSAMAVALTPLVALAALVLGIVYFWDTLKAVLGKIASAARWALGKFASFAQWVWGKFTSLLGLIAQLGTKLAEGIEWVADKIVWLADKLAEGIEWLADKLGEGAKWLGHQIASGARSVWDWLFGSDVEAEAPVIDLPVTEEPTMRCGTVAHEDALVRIPSDVLFDTAHWDLKLGAEAALKGAAVKVTSMLRSSDDRVRVEGYTDNVGGVEYNQHLSEQRAATVAHWLIQNGAVQMSNIETEGFGKSQAEGKDEAGRARDRHVEIWINRHGSTEKVCW